MDKNENLRWTGIDSEILNLRFEIFDQAFEGETF
jgi:hypothetical protein